MAVETAAVDPADAVMVAAHDWDLAGAAAVGLGTAFIARPLMPCADTVYPPPDKRVADFVELAAALGYAR